MRAAGPALDHHGEDDAESSALGHLGGDSGVLAAPLCLWIPAAVTVDEFYIFHVWLG